MRIAFHLKQHLVLIIAFFIFILASIINNNFLTVNNMYGFLIQLPAYGAAALALTFCLICGELNITMGSIIAFSGVVFAITVGNFGFIFAWIITLLLCSVFGIITGIVVAYLKIDSFVATLSMLILINGITLAVCNTQPVVVTDPVTVAFGGGSIGPIPIMTIVFVIIIIIAEFILKNTVFGRNIYAVGGNAEIAKSIGINVKFYKFIVFVIFSVLAGIGGIFLMARMNTGSPIVGGDAPLSTIPMAIIGGTALSGGKGGAFNTFVGILFMSLLFNVMQIMGIALNVQTFAKGIILLSIIVWDKYNANRDRKV